MQHFKIDQAGWGWPASQQDHDQYPSSQDVFVNGFKGVIKRKQEEIIYLISTFDQVLSHNLFYVYFDGHGYHNFSETFNTPEGLDKLDWDTINSRNWFDTEED